VESFVSITPGEIKGCKKLPSTGRLETKQKTNKSISCRNLVQRNNSESNLTGGTERVEHPRGDVSNIPNTASHKYFHSPVHEQKKWTFCHRCKPSKLLFMNQAKTLLHDEDTTR